jgi:RNA-dependent RNA polymerase
MDRISHFAKEERDRQLIPVMAAFNSFDKVVVDAHLTEPWLNALKLADRFVEEEGCDRMKLDLTKIEDHVHELYDKHREQVNVKNSPAKRDKRAPFSDLPIEVRQDKMRALSNEFLSKPRLEDVMMDEAQIRRLRASYAYLYDSQKTKTGWTRFPWDVAMRELCAIKGKQSYTNWISRI